MKLAVRYGKGAESKHVKLGEGLVGWAALHKEAVLVADVSKDPRYIKLVDDAQSEMVIPMLIKDRCVGVFDLESPELDAFTKEHKELLTLLASQAAIAIDNAQLYEEVRRNEERIEKELRFAQRVQAALLPQELPKSVKGVDVAGRFEPARELGGDLHDFLTPDPNTLVVAVGDVSGKGAPAALYGAFAAELVRSRTLRRRFTPDRFSVSGVLQAMNTTLHERQLEEYYCTLCYAFFDFWQAGSSRCPTPACRTRFAARDECAADRAARCAARIVSRHHVRRTRDRLNKDDLFVFYSDGISEARTTAGGVRSASTVSTSSRESPPSARDIVDAVFDAVTAFQRPSAQCRRHDSVAVRITA